MRMTEDELARQITVSQSLADDDDGPPDFDANDIPIYEIILKDLREAESAPQHILELGNGKILQFFLALISAYLKNNPTEITQREYLDIQSLFKKYSQQGCWRMPE